MAEGRFEEALNRLEQIAGDLETGQVDLDEAIKKYEEGMKLASFCEKKLNEIKKKVEMLVRDGSGELSAKDFDGEFPNEASAAVRPKSAGRKKRPKGESLLF